MQKQKLAEHDANFDKLRSMTMKVGSSGSFYEGEQFEPYIPNSSGYDIKPTSVEHTHTEAHSGKEATCVKFNH